MNKIFKVVWSKSKNCYVVVSEFAKNNSGKKKIVVAAILAALAMSSASISMASNDVPAGLPVSSVGLGKNASVKGDKAVGFGYNASAAGGNSVVIGSNASVAAGSPQGIAIGGGNQTNEGARVIGEQAIAIGGNTIAQGNSSIVIGGDDVVKADGIKVVYTTNNGENKTGDLRSAVQSLTGFDMRNPLYTAAMAGESGITLGMKGQSGNVGIAIGTGANAKDRLAGTATGATGQANDDVTNAIAIGTGARANRDNAIAIGGGSNTDIGGTKQSSYTLPNGTVASWAGGDKTLPGDIVSFGSAGYERQLKHVAPGEVSATSTDAINGSQLSALVDQVTYKYISIKSTDAGNKDNTGATAPNSIAIGPNAATDASASRSVAVGDGARGKVVDGVAVGSKSTADIASGVVGYNVNASRTDTYADLSGAALTSKLGGVAVGTTNQTRQINYVAAGTADTDAVNVAQLKSVNLAFTGDTGSGDVNLANSKLAVNGDNTYITTTANGKKITVSGKKQDITVANGSATASTGMADSANVANAINQAINQNKYGWNLSANGEATPVAVEKGNTVDFSGDDNVTVARNDKKISVALKKDLSKLNSASFNNTGGNETVKIDGNKGINAGNLKVTNVADGIVDKDAVNVSQLKKVDDKAEANKTAIDTNKTAIAKNAGDIATNKADIATNKDNIATNKQKIADNKTAIDKNIGDIATNKTDIATNKDNIAANKQKITDNKTAIDKNVGDIATNKANIAQNTTAIARKISLGGNSGSTDEKSLSTGDVKFNVKGENGLTTVANGDDVTVKLDDATKGKVDNAADRDLSNLTPDGKQQVKDLAAWNVVANNETAEKVEGGNTVKFIDGDNISITQNGKDFTISTKKDVTFDTVTATQTITAPKVKATTGVETPQVTGLTNTAWVPGQTQPVSGRAATEDQLKHVDDQVAENKANIADNTDKIGKNSDAIADNKQKIADNKTAIDKNSGDIATNKTDIATNKDNIAANKQKITDNKTAIDKNVGDIATNKANIAQNTTAIARKISLGGNSGSTDEKSLSTGDVKFNVKGENGLTTVANGDDVTVKLDDATKGKVDNAADRDLSNLTPDGKQQVKDLAAWNVVANNETAEKVEGGNTVKFIDGDNISITQNGKDFTISTKKDVTFDTVTAIQMITAPKVKATTGVETPQVTGLTNTAWVPGQTQPVSGRAATEDQLKHVDDQVAENKANIADNTDKIGKNADAIADNKQKIADNKTAIDKNAGDIATNKTDIATNKDNIAANKQKITDNKTAIDKNVGDIATNKANIAQNTTAIARKISLGGNSGSTDEKSLSTGDVKFNVKGENGLTTVANGDDVTVKLDDATKGKVDNAADRDLSNLTPDGKQQVKDLAAWNVVANNETAEKVEGGNTVKFIDGDNISITQNGKDFTISTKKDVTFDTVTANQTITAPKVKATTGVETPQVTGLTNTTWVPGQTQPVFGRAATEDQLKKVDDQVAENKANIADNTDKIGKNADAIADNKQKIADNKTAIDKNVGDIATNKANIAQNTTAIARKISLGGNSGSTDEKSLSTGDVKFNVKGENGLTTVANGDDVTVKLDDATKGKVDNAADRDLSNLTPDGKQQVKDLAAWNVVANNETAEKVEGGNTVKFIDGDNISITQNGKDFTISTKKDVTFDTVTATQTITAPKVKATTGVETPQVTGLTNTAWVPGQTQPVSGRAATEDQLKKVDDQVAENKTNIADNTDKIGKNADAIADNKQKIADNKTAIDKNSGDIATNRTDIATNKDNIADNKQKIVDNKAAIDKNAGDIAINKTDIATNKDNIAVNKQKIADNKTAIDKNTGDIATNKGDIATNKANIDKNTEAIARKISLGGNSGSTDEKSLSTGDVKFNVKGENGLTTVANGDDVTVKLDDATKGKVDNAADRDLSNLTPDGKQQVKDLAAWNVVANNETAEKVEGGNTVKFIDGDNISITQNGKDFTISTKKDVTFDTVTANQTITAPKVKATTGVETPQVTGLTNTTWVPGQTQPVFGRAATEDQLKKVDDQVAENKANIADNTDKIGKNADAIADNKQKIADNKTAIDKNAGDIATNKDNIADNKQKIADNKTAIDKNAGDIATNKGDIASNKANIAQNTTAIARKISLGGNNGSTDEKSLSTGDVKFNVKGENGLTTVANGDDVTVKLDDATKGKVDNAADRDLSNLTPDGKQQVKDLAAWNVVANNETAEKVEGGNTVKFIDGDNISITQNGKDFTISTKKDVTFDTVTANQTITAPKVKATTGVETPQVTGLTNTTWVPGQTQPVSGRAATEDQLKQVDDQVAENKANIADNTDKIGKNAEAIADNKQKIADNKAAIDRNAADIATNKDNIATNKQNIADNKSAITKNAGDIATNKANIDKNTEAIARKISLGGNTGSTDEKSLSTGDVKFNIKGQNGIVTEANGEDVTVKLDDATANKINNAANTDLSNLTDTGKQQVKDLSAWNVVANGNTAEKVEGGNTVKFIDGDNISITQNGKDFTIATKQDVTFNTVKANQTITAPKVKATEGVETPQVTGLTNKEWISGQTQPVSGRAATEDQLKQVDNQVAENKANIADNKDKISKNTADIAANKGNISTNKQDIADNKAAITKNTGDIATNKANIDKNTESIARKISLGGNTGSTDEKSLSTGDVKFNVKGENGLTTVANGDDVTVKLDDVTKGKIDNAANQDLSNLTDAGKQQVKDISAWNVTAAGGTVEKVQGGDTVKFQAGDNLVVNQDRTAFTYGLAKDLKGLNSVTVGDENGVSTKITPAGTTVKDAAGNSTVIKGGGMTITPADVTASPVSLTVDGLNNGGNQIHGVAPGTDDTDAVNVSQLKASNAGLQEAVNRVGTETQRVGAHAAAMAALKPIQYDPLEPTQIMAGIGNYRGETAGAIGIAHYRTEDTMFNVGVSLGTSHNMVNAGVTHKFGGSRERKDAIPERYKAGPISSVYVMQDEVSSLKKENSNQKTVIANQAARLNTLEAENERQRQELAETKQGLDDLRAVVNQLLASKG
ncbi:ESPR-type extended signal peptide-containing protein [uncultured Veillonella sp.]|uniref:ESPR-type extended signal peptide-containing protein n=1 Tax=uncultured Veillonella sp. TaxID=159268 RepID=UPI0028065586|nr:ESPR-type extended signal peptide-containing protein [uncultured Veillonella sp.]